MDYNFPSKNHYRRWVWNRIKELVSVPPKDAQVIYLAGPQDMDAKVAEQKGFKQGNMIAIEGDEAAAAALRRSGRLTVHADFLEAAVFWPPARPINVVLGDMCGGLNRGIMTKLCVALGAPHLRNAVFAVNLLRGRDADSNLYRSQLSDVLDGDKHRGRALFLAWIAELVECAPDQFGATRLADGRIQMNGGALVDLFGRMVQITGASFHTYASTAGTQKFDTVVFRNQVGQIPDWESCFHVRDKVDALRRQVAAVIAHRTRRKK